MFFFFINCSNFLFKGILQLKIISHIFISPNVCFCEPGWKGPHCADPICEPECLPGHGVCSDVNTCECFYGWGGEDCGVALSLPDCVNGNPVAPDICECSAGYSNFLNYHAESI